ncbi:hypothetical protein KN609_07215, partial [Vibrio anguillarum]|nr:hypothetical protein [Vibrio anguillarum]MBT9979582.1 hypothetical protein [Vibrio anguillarum]MBT9983183.1 hypothetical protein [Vibrio anguillarum]MBT9989342.1 hypothetical protein [Vibrio anguillarum]MBT9998279.1 hypothetical protein [Vibrio anguillarum]
SLISTHSYLGTSNTDKSARGFMGRIRGSELAASFLSASSTFVGISDRQELTHLSSTLLFKAT